VGFDAAHVRALIWGLSFGRFSLAGFFAEQYPVKYFSPNMRFQIWSGEPRPERDRGIFH
jgi:hypothetical protein